METICKFSIQSKILYQVLKRLNNGTNVKLSVSSTGLTFYSTRPKCSVSIFTDVLKDYVYYKDTSMEYSFNKTSMYSTFSKKDNILIEIEIVSGIDTIENIFSYIQDNIRHNIRMSILNYVPDIERDAWIESPESTIVIRDNRLLSNLFKSHKSGLYISTKEHKINIGGPYDYVVLDNEHRGIDINLELNINKHFWKIFPINSEYCIFNFKINDNNIANIVFIEYNIVYKYEGKYYNQS